MYIAWLSYALISSCAWLISLIHQPLLLSFCLVLTLFVVSLYVVVQREKDNVQLSNLIIINHAKGNQSGFPTNSCWSLSQTCQVYFLAKLWNYIGLMYKILWACHFWIKRYSTTHFSNRVDQFDNVPNWTVKFWKIINFGHWNFLLHS